MIKNNKIKSALVLLLLSTSTQTYAASTDDILKQLEAVKKQVNALEQKLANQTKALEQAEEEAKSVSVSEFKGNGNSALANFERRLSEVERSTAEASETANLAQRLIEVEQEKSLGNAEKFGTVEVGKKGLKFTSPDKQYELRLTATTQFDSRNFIADKGNTGRDDLLARRLRPTLEAKAGNASFRLMPDFAGSSTRIFDAHADYKLTDAVQFRFGKFKTPVSLERLQSAADLHFIERGHPSNLAPSRDFGAQVYGNIIPEVLEYQLGVFNGNADLANTDNDDDDKKDIAGRIFAHPFKNSETAVLQGLGLGVGASTGDREGSSTKRILGTYKTPGQQDFFTYRSDSFANGKHTRLYPQAYWYYNNIGLLAEYATSEQEVTRGARSGELKHKAWQVEGSYVLTGELVNFRGGVKPFSDFNFEKGGIGAWEVVARIGETDIDNKAFSGGGLSFADPSVSASKAETLGFGLNWYLSENLKLATNFEQTKFEGGASGGRNRADEKVALTRVQFRF